jgi:PAS domain S-box-containing protein
VFARFLHSDHPIMSFSMEQEPERARTPLRLRSEAVLANVRNPFLLLDDRLAVVSANRSYYQTFKVTKAETEGALVYELGDGQWDLPQLRQHLDGARQRGRSFRDFQIDQTFPGIGRRVMQLDARRLERVVTSPVESDLVLFSIEDITERSRLEEELKGSEQRYRRLFDSAEDGILIVNPNSGAILDANLYLARLLGYRQNQLVGKELWQLGLFGDLEASRAAMAAVQRDGQVRYGDRPVETTDGRQIEVELVTSVHGEGEQRIIQCNIRDRSDRRKQERDAGRRLTELLDQDRRKDEFLAVLGHEMRTPLGAIRNALELLGDSPNANPVETAAIGMIRRQVGQLAYFVDDLLDTSRLTTGRIALHRERIEARTAVRRAVDTVRPLFTERRQTLSVGLDGDPIWIDADSARLEQVVLNLLTNSAKYTNEGGSVWITASADSGSLELRIRDTGIGISADFLPRIFDLFTQAEDARDRSQGGLGIGLALVWKLVQMHEGTVAATSSGVGRGSEFVVRLPLAATGPVLGS